MVKEASAWQTVRKEIYTQAKGKCIIQRIESPLTGSGIPDTYTLIEGCIGIWMEGKALKNLPKKPQTPLSIKLTLPQAIWLDKHAEHGGKSYVWCRIDGGWLLIVNKFLRLVKGNDKYQRLTLNDYLISAKNDYNSMCYHYSTCKKMVEFILNDAKTIA